MKTLLLTLGVLCVNIFVYVVSGIHQYYPIISHIYYGVILIAAAYENTRNQNILLGLTTVANLFYAFTDPTNIGGIAIAFLYTVIAFNLVSTIRQLQFQRLNRTEEMDKISMAKTTLEKRVRNLSVVSEVSQTANAALELEELFHRTIEILSQHLGIYRGTLNLYENGQIVQPIEVNLGLTEAELKRGTDHQIEEIERKVLADGKTRGIPHQRIPKPSVILLPPEEVESKDKIDFWCLPVIVEDQIIGTLRIDKAKDELTAAEDLHVLEIIAAIIAQRVKIKQTIDALVQSERLAALGKLVTTIAHEVRNPLGSIRLATQLLSEPDDRFLPLSDEEQAEIDEYTTIIIKEVDRLNRSIEQLLAFGKPATADAEQCDIHELLDSCIATYQPEFDQYEIDVIRKYSKCPSINVNQDAMTQVILNLFSNAIEAMEKGGTLTINTDYSDQTETTRIRIQDTGLGISESDIQNLFDAFYTTKQKGTGLGLYISQKILAEHGGSIEVDAELSTGTAFIISIPNTTD
ncbi:GAF domain-containing protein [Candidatus Poribacteria bacterium]|nr:GAF domain-containing protein [Candidatus Poribacteria bacterium]MYI93372.1 GAF domain-containing protein [Candidatus Poribacteria bacterium]